MKKLLILFAAIFLCFSLGGCAVPRNTVSAVQLSDREKLIVSAVSDGSFVFDFSVDDTYAWLSVWVEQYIFGKKVQNPAAKTSCGVKNSGTIIVYMGQTDNAAAHPQMLNLYIKSGEGQYSQLNIVRDIGESIKDAQSAWAANDTAAITVSGNMVLGCVRYSKNNKLAALTKEFFDDYQNHLDELKNDDVTYIIRCEFAKAK